MPPTTDPIFMDASLAPNRSLSDRSLMLFMGLMFAASLLSSAYFIRVDALPVLAFFGLDLAILLAALLVSRRKSRQVTRVRVTTTQITLLHTDGRGRQKMATLPTAFTRVELNEPVGPADWLTLAVSGTRYIVGRFLTPDERVDFAAALRAAIRTARASAGTGTAV